MSRQSVQSTSSLLTDATLHEDDLSEQAKSKFGFHSEVLRVFQLHRRCILANERLTPIGRHLVCSELEKQHGNYKQVLNYAASSTSAVAMTPIAGPLIICAMPRTGSTLLYNLLACDTTCRAPLYTDMAQPVPPVARSDTSEHKRRADIERLNEQNLGDLGLTKYMAAIRASHPSFDIEEDELALLHVGVNICLSFFAPVGENELENWFRDGTNKDYAYDYHKTFFELLNAGDAPQSHWLLKTPTHVTYLNALIRYYPHASLIMTHRHLSDVLPSYYSLRRAELNLFFEEADTVMMQTVLERMIRLIDVRMERIIEFHDSNSTQNHNVCDVVYEDLVKQPIETVRRIYDRFDFLHWTPEFETAMNEWLHNHPQGKQGRNSYSLTDVGMTSLEIDKHYQVYTNMFLSQPGSPSSNRNSVP